jgi:hypothetical protein
MHFVGVEIVLGKLLPLPLLFAPRFRKPFFIFLASGLILLGILFMRLDLVAVGELAPLL